MCRRCSAAFRLSRALAAHPASVCGKADFFLTLLVGAVFRPSCSLRCTLTFLSRLCVVLLFNNTPSPHPNLDNPALMKSCSTWGPLQSLGTVVPRPWSTSGFASFCRFSLNHMFCTPKLKPFFEPCSCVSDFYRPLMASNYSLNSLVLLMVCVFLSFIIMHSNEFTLQHIFIHDNTTSTGSENITGFCCRYWKI